MEDPPVTTPGPEATGLAASDTITDKRKARTIMATDSEWQIISERAITARMSTSSFMVERAIATSTKESDDSLPVALCRRVARDVLALSRMEELRHREAGETGAWKEAVATAEAVIEAEETAGD